MLDFKLDVYGKGKYLFEILKQQPMGTDWGRQTV